MASNSTTLSTSTPVVPNLIGLESLSAMQTDMQWINQYGNSFFNYSGMNTDAQYAVLLNYMQQALAALAKGLATCQAQMPTSKS